LVSPSVILPGLFKIEKRTISNIKELTPILEKQFEFAPMLAAAKASERILIVDDLPQIRTLIRAYLEEETGFCICGEAIDGLMS
jgi:hypothetical protein